MSADLFRFDGKRALVVGGASGMGRASAELLRDLGAEVFVFDIQPDVLDGVTAIQVDIREPGEIDKGLAGVGGPIHVVLACAGVADGSPGIEKVLFLGHRHLIDTALAQGMLPRGSAIGVISSRAGKRWRANRAALQEYLDTPDFETGAAWIAAHDNTVTYVWGKESILAWVEQASYPMLKQGVRINALMPGPTDTPLARANASVWLTFGSSYRAEAGIELATPLDEAAPLVFLVSDAARYITGIEMIVDLGMEAAVTSGQVEDPAQDVMRSLGAQNPR